MSLEGVYSVLPTAFSDSGAPELPRPRNVVDLLISNGGPAAIGAAGAVVRLDDQECAAMLETVISEPSGRTPVRPLTITEGTRGCLAYSRPAKQLGAIGTAVQRRPAPARPATRARAEAMDVPTRRAFDRVLTWVTTQKGFAWISV